MADNLAPNPSSPTPGPHRRRGVGEGTTFLFAAILFATALSLLAQVDSETRWFAGVDWPLQPRFWPTVALLGMASSTGWLLWRTRTQRSGWLNTVTELLTWVRPMEYAAWFAAYAMIVPWLGYPLATLLFLALLGARVGIRSVAGQLALAATGIATVLIFRTLLAVKMPPGAIYELLPAGVRNFVTLYL